MKSLPPAEILAATEEIDEGKQLWKGLTDILKLAVKLVICFDY